MAIIKSDLEVPMADRLRSIAESELGETEDIREKSLTAVRQWLNEHEDSYEMGIFSPPISDNHRSSRNLKEFVVRDCSNRGTLDQQVVELT